jgi:hypothetical protein
LAPKKQVSGKTYDIHFPFSASTFLERPEEIIDQSLNDKKEHLLCYMYQNWWVFSFLNVAFENDLKIYHPPILSE